MGVDVGRHWFELLAFPHSNSRMEYEAPILMSSVRGEVKDDVKLARRHQPSSLNEVYTDHAS